MEISEIAKRLARPLYAKNDAEHAEAVYYMEQLSNEGYEELGEYIKDELVNAGKMGVDWDFPLYKRKNSS